MSDTPTYRKRRTKFEAVRHTVTFGRITLDWAATKRAEAMLKVDDHFIKRIGMRGWNLATQTEYALEDIVALAEHADEFLAERRKALEGKVAQAEKHLAESRERLAEFVKVTS